MTEFSCELLKWDSLWWLGELFSKRRSNQGGWEWAGWQVEKNWRVKLVRESGVGFTWPKIWTLHCSPSLIFGPQASSLRLIPAHSAVQCSAVQCSAVQCTAWKLKSSNASSRNIMRAPEISWKYEESMKANWANVSVCFLFIGHKYNWGPIYGSRTGCL